MGAEVTLVIKADNSQYIARMKEAQAASQKLHETSVAGEKREKGILEEIDATLARLEKSKRRAFTYEDIEKYNKKITEAKQHLQEYENAGKEVTKGTDSMVQSIGKWIVGLGIAAKALDLLKTAFKDTLAGMLVFNVAGAAMKQVLYNIVTGVGDWNKNVAQSIVLAKQMNDLRLKDRLEMIKSKELMREYNKLYTESIENMDDGAGKIEALTKAKEKYQAAIQIEIDSTKEQLDVAVEALKLAPESLTAQNNAVELYGKLQDLLSSQESGIRRISRQIATEQAKLFTDVLTNISSFQKEIHTEIDDRLKESAEEEKKIREESLKIEKQFTEDTKQELAKRRNEKERLGLDEMKRIEKEYNDKKELAEDKVKEQISIEKKYYQWFWDQSDKQKDKEKKDSDEAKDKKTANLEAIAQAVDSASQFTMSLYDNELTKLEWQADSQMRILDAKYKKDIISAGKNAKRKEEIEQAYNDKRYAIELELDKKRRAIARKAAIAEKISGLFSIGINTAVAITKALPNVLLAALAAAAGLLQAGIVASKPVPQFAKGGWTGNGTYKDSSGERVAGVVHEKEFVVKRGPAYKFREVLEAINKDDRAMIFNKFNKFAPDLAGGTTVNNVVVENEGPNKRLDAVISEQRKLNAKLSNESIQSIGNVRIIRKGSNIRTVKK